MAEDGQKEVEKEKVAIRGKGEQMLVAAEKWLYIGERISCVGHSSCTAGMGRWRMDGGAEGSGGGEAGDRKSVV